MSVTISFRSIVITIGAIGAIAAFLCSHYRDRWSTCPSSECNNDHLGYFEYEDATRPHNGSWQSWYHPQRLRAGERQGNPGLRAGAVTQDWNILYHLGGNGPWVEKHEDVVGSGIAVPEGCQVEQVHMMARHAERYPTKKVANSRLAQ